MQLVTITEAATEAGKSIQTIRRMIKQRKIQVKRQKTPQGFNYLIVKDSLTAAMNAAASAVAASAANEAPIQEVPDEAAPAAMHDAQPDIHDVTATTQTIERDHRIIAEFERFGSTINTLIEQNTRDKENFFQLIKTFQDRVITLENQIKLLEAPKSSWWKFWK